MPCQKAEKGEIWKTRSFSKLAVGTMGAMGVMPKGSKKVTFGKFAVFQKWLWALVTMGAMGTMPKG